MRLMLKTAWDREDLAFMAVESVCRIEDPKFKAFSKSSIELILTWWSPVSNIRPLTSSRMVTGALSALEIVSGTSRSLNCSL